MGFFLAFILCVGLLAELLSLYAGMKKIRFQYRPKKEQAEQGEEIPVSIEVSNTGMMPVSYLMSKSHFPKAAQLPKNVTVEEDQFQQTVNMVFRMWGRQKRSRTVNISIEKRGVHYFRGAMLERTDFLGLRKVWDFYDQQEQILVYPRCLENQSLISAMGEYFGDLVARQHLLRDPVLTVGVREYTGAEPMKTISWSQSARRNQLMVREFDFTRDLSCTVLLAVDGMMPTHAERLDNCCNIVRTVCQELVDRQVNVEFYTNSPKEGFGAKNRTMWKCTATAGNQMDLLRGLAFLYPGPANCSGEIMAVSAARAAGHKTAFVVVAPFDNERIRNMVQTLEEYSGMRALLVLESDYFDHRVEGGTV